MGSIFSGLLRYLIRLRALKRPLKIDSLTGPYHRVPAEMSDMEMFLEFQKFKQMMKATAPAPVPAPPPPPPPPTFASVAAYPPVFQFKRLPGAAPAYFPMKKESDSASVSSQESRRPHGFDYDWMRNQLFAVMRPMMGEDKSQHPNIFWVYKHIYEEHPERFTHVSDVHSAVDGRMYFSINYTAESETNGKMITNFHVYGEMSNINGKSKFRFRSLDILCGRQVYENAAVFYV